MGVDAAETEGTDGSTPGNAVAPSLPWRWFCQDAKRAVVQFHAGLRRAEVGRGGERFILHGQQHLGQCCSPRGGQQVADIGLDGADDAACVIGVNITPEEFEAGNFNRIADRGAGGVTFNQVDIARLPAGLLVGGTHGAELTFRHGSEQAPPHIIGQTDAPDDAVNPVAVGHGIFGPLEQEQPRTFANHKAVACCIERRTDAPFGKGTQLGKTHLGKERIGT